MKFLCDEMLGTLAKWLRILGYDTEYVKNMEDEEIIEFARKERRIIITRDKLLARRADVSLYIDEKELEEQLRKVVTHFNLEIGGNVLSRCTVCNVPVVEIKKEEAKGNVPEYVWENSNVFWKCKKCGRIYWLGSHWQNMEGMLKRLKENKDKKTKEYKIG